MVVFCHLCTNKIRSIAQMHLSFKASCELCNQTFPLDIHSIRFCVSKQVSFRPNEVNFMANKTRQMSKVECSNYIKLHVLTLNSNELMCLPRSYFMYSLPFPGLFLNGFFDACCFLPLANFLARNQGANYCWKKNSILFSTFSPFKYLSEESTENWQPLREFC